MYSNTNTFQINNIIVFFGFISLTCIFCNIIGIKSHILSFTPSCNMHVPTHEKWIWINNSTSRRCKIKYLDKYLSQKYIKNLKMYLKIKYLVEVFQYKYFSNTIQLPTKKDLSIFKYKFIWPHICSLQSVLAEINI